ncbi:MAG: amidase [Cyanobacteria bacterium J06642_3]
MTSKYPEFTYLARAENKISGSLSNLRLGVKDLFHIADMPTTAGNPDWLSSHFIPKVTAPSVSALLDAGATFIGKTLTDELAYSLEGVNKHYGTPINPKAPQRLPGGSSSGSAVAVANQSIDIGLGTDTGGSIRVPASYNGIYGFRPSHGAVNCEQIVPLSPRFDTVGWLTRDLNTLNQVATILLPSSIKHNLSQLVIGNIAGIDSWTEAYQPWLESLSNHFDSLQNVEITSEQLTLASKAFRILQGREIWRIHGDWIELQQPDLAPEIRDRFMWCKSLSKDDEQQAEVMAQEFVTWWQSNVLPSVNHVLLLPTTLGAAPLLGTPQSELAAYRTGLLGLTAPASLTRAPQISLPYLTADQAPWGVSLLARSGCDRALLDCAAKLETLIGS